MPNQDRKSGVNPVGIIAAIGIGAVAAVGGYLFGRFQETQEEEKVQSAQRQSSQPQRQRPPVTSPTLTGNNLPDDADEKFEKPTRDRECVICFREFQDVMKDNEEIHTTPCGHVFCYKCIHKALVERGRCPVCRNHVEVDHTLRIYL